MKPDWIEDAKKLKGWDTPEILAFLDECAKEPPQQQRLYGVSKTPQAHVPIPSASQSLSSYSQKTDAHQADYKSVS